MADRLSPDLQAELERLAERLSDLLAAPLVRLVRDGAIRREQALGVLDETLVEFGAPAGLHACIVRALIAAARAKVRLRLSD